MAASDEVISCDPGEVGDVLGEHDIAACYCAREDVGIRPSCQSQFGGGGSLDLYPPQCHGQGGRIHFIEQ